MLQRLIALQQADSAFPSGSFAFSNGIEGLAALLDGLGGAELGHAVEAVLRHRWAGSDRVALVLAHRAAGDLARLAQIDAAMEAACLPEPMRTGSRRNGGALLAAHTRIGTAGADGLQRAVRDGRLLGHLAVMQGALWRSLGLDETAITEIAGYQCATALVTASVRLGLVGAIEAQRILTALMPVLAEIAAQPMQGAARDDRESPDIMLVAFTPLIEIATMRHARADLRLFAN
ncbi:MULTISPECIES: urease accessory protein UreF [unclassified Methylobacterium]|uniref:urease accessory protein UreF n=1 Tax=unclassified Methylobacterium TaxID=2615210 RepID=UPI0006FB6608|nr:MULTISPECIES: urease accessory UreF family protein [unclassified Methylobacterium]KQO57608.1 urease accessory protein UreF [Methylobacterium sp. Leaf86]KQO94588.1 urease accessory protein UreF [Methylobacterium sp. Leaf91]MBO1021677.1 urease accessory protein UreF [Methylobacterium sp. SD274]